MASLLCPRCKNPLEVPRPAPEKISCTSCGASFRNQSYKPGSNGSSAALGSASQDAMASPQTAQKLASSGLPVPVAAAAGAGTAQAVAEPRVAKSLASPETGADNAAPAPAPNGGKMALMMGAGGAAVVVLLAVVVFAMVKSNSNKDPEPSASSSKKKDGGRKPADLGTRKDGDSPELPPFDPKAAKEEIDDLLKKQKDDPLDMDEMQRLEELQQGLKVFGAIEKGVKHLRTRIPAAVHLGPHGGDSNTRAGAVALLGLTLVSCGAEPNDPDVIKVAELIRNAAPHLRNPYDIAPAIFFLDALYKDETPTESDLKLINTLGLRLVAGQRGLKYLWRYDTVEKFGPEEEEALKDKLEKRTFQCPLSDDVDMSCSQFAALGMWTANRRGIKQENNFDPLRTGVFQGLERAAQTARQMQNIGAGTWNYGLNPVDGAFKDTSTCCGLILVCLGEAVKEKPLPYLQDEAVVNALKHLENVMKKHPTTYNPNNHEALGKYYFLWALERTALILGLKRIGEEMDEKGNKGQDWHKWGSGIILPAQNANGGWYDGRFGDVPDTCFALLFLKRINLFKDLTQKLRNFAMGPVRRIDMASVPTPQPVPAPTPIPSRPRNT